MLRTKTLNLRTSRVKIALFFLVYTVSLMKRSSIAIGSSTFVIGTSKRAQVDSRYSFYDL